MAQVDEGRLGGAGVEETDGSVEFRAGREFGGNGNVWWRNHLCGKCSPVRGIETEPGRIEPDRTVGDVADGKRHHGELPCRYRVYFVDDEFERAVPNRIAQTGEGADAI